MRKSKRSVSTVILILIFCVGVGLLLYPTVSDKFNSRRQTKVITEYAEQVNQIDNDVYEQLWADAQAYNLALQEKEDPYTMTEEEQADYENQLNIRGDGVMGYIDIPKIDCYLPIYHSMRESVLQVAVGHMESSSLPVGGESTHCVLSGHRGLPSAKLFSNLDKLIEGDRFTLHILNETLTYEVDRILIVEPQQVGELGIEEGKDYCTLVTCTPYGINTHRLLVRGHRVANEDGPERVTADAMQVEPMVVAPLAAVPILAFLMIVLLVKTRRKRRPEGKK